MPNNLKEALKTRPQSQDYTVTFDDNGVWLHATGSDFVFAYVDNSWDADLKQQVKNAFEKALKVPTLIKQAVLETSGEAVKNGTYLLDQTAMITAMNTIEGMGETEVDSSSESGSGTATSINTEFFEAVLGGLGGNVDAMDDYLKDQMHTIQAQTHKSTVTKNFGTILGMVGVMPVINVVVTSFSYIYSDQQTSDWFVSVNSGSHEEYSYNYSYTVVKFNYNPS